MVCRDYRLSSVLIAQVRTASWFDDAQIQSLFHTLRHDPRAQGDAAIYWTRQQVFDRVVGQARHDIDTNPLWRSARRAGLRQRLESELEQAHATMPDSTLSALDRLQQATVESQRQLRVRLQQLGGRLGMSEREATIEFHRLRSEAPSGRQARATERERADLGLIPGDPKTRYALRMLQQMTPRREPAREVDRWLPVAPQEAEDNPVIEVGVSSVADRIETRRADGTIEGWHSASGFQQQLIDQAAAGTLPAEAVRRACVNRDPSPYAGYRTRCDRCGQFVGARPHNCIDTRRCELNQVWEEMDGASFWFVDPHELGDLFRLESDLQILDVPAQVDLGTTMVMGHVVVRRGPEAINADPGRNPHELDIDDAGLSDTLQCQYCYSNTCRHADTARVLLRRYLEDAAAPTPAEAQAIARDAILAATISHPTSTQPEPTDQEPPRIQISGPTLSLADNAETFRALAQQGAHDGVLFESRAGALRGLAAGVRFGIELEYSGDGEELVPGELHEAGLIETPLMRRYHHNQNVGWHRWSLEEDCTVTGELVTPILQDTDQTWAELATACSILTERGTTHYAGSHTNISCDDYTGADAWRLAHLFRAHEADLFRMGRTPGVHRDLDSFSSSLADPGMAQWDTTVARYATRHGHMVNMSAAFQGPDRSRIEFRFPDASHDAGVIQAQVKLCAALTNFARHDHLDIGQHQRWEDLHNLYRSTSPLNLTIGQFESQTAGIRDLIDRLFDNDDDRIQMAQLWGRGEYTH